MSNKIPSDGIKCNSFSRGRYYYDEKTKTRTFKIPCGDIGPRRCSYLPYLYVCRVTADHTVSASYSTGIMAVVFLLKERYIL